MKQMFSLLALAGATVMAPAVAPWVPPFAAFAQETAPERQAPRATWWLQIEAQPTLPQAEERARAWAALFADVAGFATPGWFTIALGPFADRDAAEARLRLLLDEALVPGDSFLTAGERYGAAFWPPGNAPLAPPLAPPLATVSRPANGLPEMLGDDVASPATPVAVPAPTPAEDLASARADEAGLDQAGREEIQSALQWFGHYQARIDGAFGPGTRASISAWQEAAGVMPTGVLTPGQRADLLAAARQAKAALGLTEVREAEAGIQVTLPLALVEFDHYEPPFVHFHAKDNSGLRVVLISRPGDQAALYTLYDQLQTLEAVPPGGQMQRSERSFSIDAQNGTVASHSFAELSRGLIKGYMLIWDPRQAGDIDRVLAALKSSFRSTGDKALDPGIAPMSDEDRAGLLAGLDVRRPALSRSGFYLDAAGTVATVAEAVEGCNRITLDLRTEARVLAADRITGLALLTPISPVAAPAYADLLTGPGHPGEEVAVAGYSYEDKLPAPVLSFGTLEEMRGLDGETSLARLNLRALPGDAGGPVLDGTGTVIGMLLPQPDGARKLPETVSYALQAATLAARLNAEGILPHASERQGAMAPEDLNRLARRMTVLVSCW